MFNQRFSHYLTYGATDQHTFIELSGVFDGLIVPGTIAAFQRDGTGGFVLTLSATDTSPAYLIDPRFPLFQQGLSTPKKSHLMLAELLGDEGLVVNKDPSPEDFDDARLRAIARQWVDFNMGYTGVTEKFDKYAARLKEEIIPENVKLPSAVIAPYFMVSGADDPWWQASKKLFDFTLEALSGRLECIRVIAVKSTSFLREVLDDTRDKRLMVWVNDLHELQSGEDTLSEYCNGISHASSNEKQVFALYGGFFSVLMSNFGLMGSCHGVGFSEHRNWIELPRSGPAPARYYSRFLHRYISQEQAYELWKIDSEKYGCDCAECESRSPLELEYHALMKHSVHCRNLEIQECVGKSVEELREMLIKSKSRYTHSLSASSLSERKKSSLERLSEHLSTWISVLKGLA